ncbi:DinB family protein [Flagellimonas myxillae]|uniref:DinB family protein n=1 Tax=Flagellimonas myxillae TaxID=2942214 RepID=UPI00201EDFB2|nr:DinB family protein [Muricauda myxillae]MCL6267420.1 DinB family protein [Muricauda myxillae]
MLIASMDKQFDIILKNRIIFKRILENTPNEELLKIPNGFRNNIWWNIAHAMVTQQLLVYKLSGLAFTIEEELINKYRKGTAPEGEPDAEEIEKISGYLTSTIEQMQEDYSNGAFKNFEAYMTTPKIGLDSVEDAISFLAFHDGIHLGAILALQKVIKV